MRISNNRVNNTSINQNFQTRTNRTRSVRKNFDAFRVEISQRALLRLSEEFNDQDDFFPIHNPDALSYTKNSKIIYQN